MSIQVRSFGQTASGEEVLAYTIENEGFRAEVLNLGCIVNRLYVPDKNGAFEDIVLGCDSIEDHLSSPFFGAVIGRFAGRIKAGKFQLLGKNYQLACNDGENHLHGGTVGFNQRIWKVDPFDENGNELCFRYISPDGEEGYPGTMNIAVRYCFEGNTWQIDYEATCDRASILNLTNHSYFNLAGHGSGRIDDQMICILSDSYCEADENLLISGRFLPVEGTAYDLREMTLIAAAMQKGKNDPIMQCPACAGGFDTSFPLDNQGKFLTIAKAYDPQSGRLMEVQSDQPCVQFYTGNFLNNEKGKEQHSYQKRAAFCIETQHFPDSPNFEKWPTTTLLPGETFHSRTAYIFSAK